MEDNFRNALIIISTIIIAAIFIHGLWTIRKNKNPYKLKAKPEPVVDLDRKFDGTGLDQDGVGQPKVIGKTAVAEQTIAANQQVTVEPAPVPDYSEEPLPRDLAEPSLGTMDALTNDPHHDIELTQDVAETTNVSTQQVQASASVYKDPVIQAKPSIAKVNTKAAAELKRKQIEINFNDANAAQSAQDKASTKSTDTNNDVEAEFLVISVVAPESQLILGAALLPLLLTLGMRYGEMNIFHRHQDNAGNGDITFSLANMLNPGTFDLNQIESFATKGISLFMTLPNPGNAFEVFEHMLAAARHLAEEFNGQLLDDKRSVFTHQTEQHYITLIREFERKNRIKAV